jgi:hypothetical protein
MTRPPRGARGSTASSRCSRGGAEAGAEAAAAAARGDGFAPRDGAGTETHVHAAPCARVTSTPCEGPRATMTVTLICVSELSVST